MPSHFCTTGTAVNRMLIRKLISYISTLFTTKNTWSIKIIMLWDGNFLYWNVSNLKFQMCSHHIPNKPQHRDKIMNSSSNVYIATLCTKSPTNHFPQHKSLALFAQCCILLLRFYVLYPFYHHLHLIASLIGVSGIYRGHRGVEYPLYMSTLRSWSSKPSLTE